MDKEKERKVGRKRERMKERKKGREKDSWEWMDKEIEREGKGNLIDGERQRWIKL